VRLAGNGLFGLQIAIEEIPDFIYLDIRIPGLDGFEVLDGLRRSDTTSNIPVIVLSNCGDDELRERGLKLGALEFLVKADMTPDQSLTACDFQRSLRDPLSGFADFSGDAQLAMPLLSVPKAGGWSRSNTAVPAQGHAAAHDSAPPSALLS
jgi:CheY-like chemotaxis protein